MGGANAAAGGRLDQLRRDPFANYTQQDAQQVIDGNSADDNAAFMKLAERLIQQQDAAVASPAVIRANVPEQGQVLTFHRAVVVDTWADLGIQLEVRAPAGVSWGGRLALLGGVLLGLGLLAGVGRWAGRR